MPQDNGPRGVCPRRDNGLARERREGLQVGSPGSQEGTVLQRAWGAWAPLSSPEWREIYTAVHGAPNPMKGKRASQKP